MFACALLTFTASLGAVKFRKLLQSKLNSSATRSSAPIVSEADAIFRCDTKPDLPRSIKVLLDKHFPGWQFPDVSDDDCQSVKTWGGKDAYAQLIQGDFDGDGRDDYAVLIKDDWQVDGEGRVLTPSDVLIVAFLNKRGGFNTQVVTREGGGCLQLMRKGDRTYDYEAQREFTYPHDTIMSGFGMGGTSYLYENGKFRAIITSD